jgi:RNA polymerase sigma-70 factor, ECF subfamily
MTMAGDRAVTSFDDWYVGVRPRLMRAITALVGDPGLAEDLCAEAFTRAFRRWPHVATEVRDPDAWVFTVAVNLARRSWRTRLRSPPTGVPAAQATTDRVRDVDLWRLVQALPRRQRQVVVLRYLGDLTEAAIADVLKTSPGAVSASLTKARAALRAGLTEGGSR